jgi:C-terminal processing protease CtpA/Prc
VDRTVSIMRGGYTDVTNSPAFQFKMLPGEIAYLTIDHFESNAGVKAFEAALPQIMSSRGLILDFRRNGGGSTNYGLEILSYLTNRPIPTALSMIRGETGLDRTRREKSVVWTPVNGTTVPYQNPRSQHFDGPVTVLAGPQTFSAGEDFLVSFSVLKRGPIVGEATGGSTGQPMQFGLPGGGRARICVKRDSFPDGSPFVGRGIQPTVVARSTVEDVRQRRDVVLEAGIAALGKPVPPGAGE